jgi:hypothetical protein
MNFSNYRFTLDIQKAQAQISIPVRYRDTGHMLYITLADGGQPYTIADGCRVDLYVKKPNGSPLINACYIEDNTTVRYDFNAYTANVAGVHYCEVRIIDEMERVITSPSFMMVVDERVVFDDDIITDEDRDTLLALDVIASEADRRSAEFDRAENEQLRSVAEDEREGAEIARVTAENARVSAENARKSAESARVSAENARKSAETARDQKLANFDSRITGVERYLSGENFVIDDATAYEKKVPSNACEKAKILSIGGMTYKKKTDEGNRMPYPYVGIGGLSYKVANGAITVTSGEETDFIISSGDAVYPAGTYIFEVGEQESNYVQQIGLQFYGTAPTVTHLSNYKCQFTATSNFTITRFTARFSSSYNAQGEFTATLHPMLYKADAPITWQPRGDWLSHTKVKAIESWGANLIPYPYDTMPTSKNGLAITHNGDGSIVINGTASGELWYFLGNVQAKKGDTLTLTGCPNGGNTSVYRLYANARNANNVDIYADDLNDIGDGETHTVISDYVNYFVYINIASGTVCNALTFKPMLNLGMQAFPFAKRSVIDAFTIPEAVQALEGYGLGLEGYPNTVEYANGIVKLVKRVKEAVIDNVFEASRTYDNIQYYAFAKPSDFIGYGSISNKIMIDGYVTRTDNGDYDNPQHIGTATGEASWDDIWVGFPIGTTLEEAQAALHGKSFVYRLTVPEIEDISDIMPKENLIKVLGGGRIVAENEQSDPVPFSIKYLVTYQREDA